LPRHGNSFSEAVFIDEISNGRHRRPFFCQRRRTAFTNILYPESAASDRMAAAIVTLKSLWIFRRQTLGNKTVHGRIHLIRDDFFRAWGILRSW
jgi:hypothetical protein